MFSIYLIAKAFCIDTGTTVLPEVASGPGMFPSLLVFIGMSKHFEKLYFCTYTLNF